MQRPRDLYPVIAGTQIKKQPSLPKTEEELTWVCAIGNTGTYLCVPVLYQGCGVIPPRVAYGRISRRSCLCEQLAYEQHQVEEQRQSILASWITETYSWLGPNWSRKELVEKTFENFDYEKQYLAYETTMTFVEEMDGTLILHGSLGTGKTHLLSALCNRLRQRKRPMHSRFATAPGLFHAIADRINNGEIYTDIIQKTVQTPLLVIDDIDTLKYTPFREEIYFEIIDARTCAHRPIAISTNNLAELSSFVGGKCASRLSIGRTEVDMTGSDYRATIRRQE